MNGAKKFVACLLSLNALLVMSAYGGALDPACAFLRLRAAVVVW